MINWPQVSVDTEKEYDMCFVCGPKNPIGLKLKFTHDDKEVKAEFTPGKLHQGWSGVVHGGIISAVLDEAMSYAALFVGVNTITARIQARFKHPVRIGEHLVITAHVTKKTRRLVEAKGELKLKDGTPLAESTATMFILSPRKEPRADA